MRSNIAPVIREDDEFPSLLEAVTACFDEVGGPFFTTDAEDLFGVFLAALPDHLRQTYTCHCCRRFFERYGGLVTIGPDGAASPAMWPMLGDYPEVFAPAVDAVRAAVSRAKVTGVFLSSEKVWGEPVTGYWSHLAVRPKPSAVYRATPLKSASQAMAEKAEERGMLLRGLAEFSRETVARAVPLLEADALYRSEKVLGVAKWLMERHEERDRTKRKDYRENLVWRAVATAPPGWAHIRSTMVSTLLDDLAAGLPVDTVQRRFAEKMHPLHYLRPQASPSAGNIAQAEKLVESLGIAASLKRRFAMLSDLRHYWTPKPATTPVTGGGVFAHLKATTPAKVDVVTAPTGITWEKFARTVLPTAERITYNVPGVGPFVQFVAAADPDAPPILQWDAPDARNAVSTYVYHGGSSAHRFALVPYRETDVVALVLAPWMWAEGRELPNMGKSAVAVLAGAYDTDARESGLFPETLKSDLHAVRATIEAHSRRTPLLPCDGPPVAGVTVVGSIFRVTTGRTSLTYKIDRWD